MASSDDEAEALPLSVSNYHFVDHKEEPVSFSTLPIQWDEVERLDGSQEPVFLYGTADDGLQKVYKQVTAWRFDICGSKPEISVLSKENVWIKLQKPRKSFEDIIRTILITVQCLHVLKSNPNTPSKSLWDQLAKIFSLYEVRPSQNDLGDHMPLISEAVERDDILANSQFLLAFLEEPINRRSCHEDVQCAVRSSFIVDDSDDEDMVDDAVEEESDDDVFDSVCAFCDNGGNLLCCDGRCMRSFHATTEESGDECLSLGLSREEVDAIETFICKNCEYKLHQCFACGNLGSSDKSSGAEVFQCVNATCGHFYHPKCVSKLLHRENKVAAEELEKKIAFGESFSCPVHKCSVCKLGENKKVRELQFSVCRRCPKSYHRKCLPRKIAFEGSEDIETTTRAWEGLLPNRILIYCLNHDIDEEIGTPARDHIKFPGLEESKIPIQQKKLLAGDIRKGKTIDFRGSRENVVSKKGNMSDDHFQGKSAAKVSKSFERSSSEGKVLGKVTEKSLLGSESRKVKVGNVSRKSFNQNAESVLMDVDKTIKVKKSSLVGKSAMTIKISDPNKAQDNSELGKSDSSKPLIKKLNSGMLQLDADTERRLMDLMKNVASSITLEDVIKKHKVPSTHAYSLKHVVDKTIKMGKLEGSVEAVRAALRKLEEGCSIEDAEAVCEPEVLNHIFKWKNKLRVYLAPFLYGMRYSSFGRHFTKVEKLQEIVDRLHWYIQKGDTIVDFCCGANDFSILMKKKLDESGKRCSYRNFDFIPPKNDFNYEKRDWMTVQPKELPKGSQLIMGLNPPFGVKAALANKFVDKALEFNPKLLILIVPPETERLDKKKTPYDLVWEDCEFLSGKSFYLPGSVNAKDKQMDQWNVRPPVLYLWSRRDWAEKHKAIAQERDHLWSRKQEESEKGKTSGTSRMRRQPEESEKVMSSDFSRLRKHEDSVTGKGFEMSRPKQLESEKGQSSKASDDHIHLNDTFLMKESTMLTDEPEDSKSGSVVSEVHKNGSTKTSKRDSDRESRDSRDCRTNLSPEAPRKRQRFEEIPRRGDGETSEESRRDGKRPCLNEINQRPHASPNVSDHRSSLDGFLSKSVEMPPYAEVGGIGHQQSGSTNMPGLNANFRASYDAARIGSTDDIAGYAEVEGIGHQQSGSTMPGLNANFRASYDAAVRTSSTDDIAGYAEVGGIRHQQSGSTMPGPNANFRAAYDAAARTNSTDDIAGYAEVGGIRYQQSGSTMPGLNANFRVAYDAAAQTNSTDDIAGYAEVGGIRHQQSGSTMPVPNANFRAAYDAAAQTNSTDDIAGYAEVGGIRHQQSGSTMPGPNANFRAAYDAAAQTNSTDDIAGYAEVGGIRHQQSGSTMPGPNANFRAAYEAAARTNSTDDIVGYAEVGGIRHQQSGSTMPGPNAHFRAAYEAAARTNSTDGIARKYNQEPYSLGTSGWTNNVSPISDIGSRHFEERIIDQMGGHVDGLNYKPYTTGLDGYTRDSEVRSHIRHYGHPDPDNLRSNYQAGPDPGYSSRIGSFPGASYGHLGTSHETSHWMNTSAMQRYAPRLDELNHTRLGGMGGGNQMNGSGTFDPRAHLPPGFRGAPQGFASGPQYPYSNQNSAGWLNE